MQKKYNRLKKLKIKILKKRKSTEERKKRENKENSAELQKPNEQAEVYINRKCD